jgi:hypothetical protein
VASRASSFPLSEQHIEYVNVLVDRADVPGMRIDTDRDVYVVGAALNDRIVTAVVARDHLPYVTVAIATLSYRHQNSDPARSTSLDEAIDAPTVCSAKSPIPQ